MRSCRGVVVGLSICVGCSLSTPSNDHRPIIEPIVCNPVAETSDAGVVSPAPEPSRCAGGTERAPHWNFNVAYYDGRLWDYHDTSYRGPANVLLRSDDGIALEAPGGLYVTVSRCSARGMPTTTIPRVAEGAEVSIDIYEDLPAVQSIWNSYFISRICVRKSADGPILFARVVDAVNIPQDNDGLCLPIQTSEFCTMQTSGECADQIQQTEYSLTVTGTLPVTVTPQQSALVESNGRSYRVWLDGAVKQEFLSANHCEDGGPVDLFSALLLPEEAASP
jgi:hypothetical protein